MVAQVMVVAQRRPTTMSCRYACVPLSVYLRLYLHMYLRLYQRLYSALCILSSCLHASLGVATHWV